jgi:hypothetical protein
LVDFHFCFTNLPRVNLVVFILWGKVDVVDRIFAVVLKQNKWKNQNRKQISSFNNLISIFKLDSWYFQHNLKWLGLITVCRTKIWSYKSKLLTNGC